MKDVTKEAYQTPGPGEYNNVITRTGAPQLQHAHLHIRIRGSPNARQPLRTVPAQHRNPDCLWTVGCIQDSVLLVRCMQALARVCVCRPASRHACSPKLTQFSVQSAGTQGEPGEKLTSTTPCLALRLRIPAYFFHDNSTSRWHIIPSSPRVRRHAC